MKKLPLSELKLMMLDLDTPDSEIAQYLTLDDASSDAFSPRVLPDETRVDIGDAEAAIALDWANNLSRWRRQKKYRRKISGGFRGLKVVSEGDSWFQYPWILEDVIDQLFDDYAILSLGAAGDTLEEMLKKDEFAAEIARERPDLFLLSAGGNDVFGAGRLQTLVKNRGDEPGDYLNDEFDAVLKTLIQGLRGVFGRLSRSFPELRMLVHGYDYAIPNKGQWLGKPLERAGITDVALQKAILAAVVDRYNTALQGVVGEFPNARYVDCRGVVTDSRWYDELHPKNDGYAAVADRFRLIIRSELFNRRRSVEAFPQPLVPEWSAGGPGTLKEDDLAPEDFRKLVQRRARALGLEVAEQTGAWDEPTRKQAEEQISKFYEKVHFERDFLPAKFLRDGAERAKAVCRIRSSIGELGTGFLVVNRGFLMTNNHVLPAPAAAEGGIAEFGFEEGGQVSYVNLLPERFFTTDIELDFTIVACDVTAVPEATPIALLRSPATVTRHEQVNIIQHPRGRPKEVALHENKVTRVQNQSIQYQTDTEPGSSGSPVFNNNWDLVALHHQGWSSADGSATNQGVRMSAIVAKLIARESTGESFGELLSSVPDTSPYLGFFDAAGVGDTALEVEVPDFRGTRDFADVGFWNIEHFNRRVEDRRVEDVANVVARLSMDVLGLTEVDQQAMERLTQSLRSRGSAMDFKLLNVTGGQDIAVLFDQDTTEVSLDDSIAQRHDSLLRVETPGGKKAFPRAPLFARCKVMDDASTHAVEFMLIVVHLKAFGDPISRARRRLAAQSLAEIIEDIRENEKLPVILGGDFNEAINNDVLSSLTGSPDMVALTTDDAEDGAASYIGGSRRSLIDHILISGDVRPGSIQGDDAAIVRLDRRISDFSEDVSDHVPVVMRVVMRDAPINLDGDHGSQGSIVGSLDGNRVTIQVPKDVSEIHVSIEDAH